MTQEGQPRRNTQAAQPIPGGERKNIAQAVVRVPRTRTPTHRIQGRPPTIAYHHSLGHVTVDVQVKKVSPWGIPAKGPFLGSVPGSHGSTVATLSGLQLATLSSVPVSTLMPSGSGATVGPARVGPRPSSLGWSPLQYLVRYGETLKATVKSHPATILVG